MFKNSKSCAVVGFITLIVYLVAQFFLVKAAKDDAIYILACIVAAGVAAAVIGKCLRRLFSDRNLISKAVGALLAGLFAVGTIVIVFVALLVA